jgi:hypothetical protein
MAEDACACGTVEVNTGEVQCFRKFKKTVGLLVVPLIANDGTVNSIDLSTTIDLTAKVQHIDSSKRFYPILDLKDVETPQAETKFKTAKDGTKYPLSKGIKSFKATKFDIGSMYASKLEKITCGKFGVYTVDAEGNVRGIKSGTTLLPIKMQGWDVVFQDEIDDDISQLMIQFDFNILLDISEYWLLSAVDTVINANDLSGLIDANLTVGAITTTSVVVVATTDYGSGVTSETNDRIKGQVVGDFSITRTDTNVDVPILTCTEGIDGSYTLTYTIITGSIVPLRAKLVAGSGYDGYADYIDA